MNSDRIEAHDLALTDRYLSGLLRHVDTKEPVLVLAGRTLRMFDPTLAVFSRTNMRAAKRSGFCMITFESTGALRKEDGRDAAPYERIPVGCIPLIVFQREYGGLIRFMRQSLPALRGNALTADRMRLVARWLQQDLVKDGVLISITDSEVGPCFYAEGIIVH